MELQDYLALPYTITLKPDEDGDWIGEIEELEGCISHGETKAEALSRLEEAQGLWIEEALSNGQPVPKPTATEPLPSGRWLQRVPRSLHKNLARLAKIEGVSLNQLVTAILSAHLGANGSKRSTEAWSDWADVATWVIPKGDVPKCAVSYLRVLTGWLPDQMHSIEDPKDEHVRTRR